jgi:hypothetical protein
MTRPAKLPRIKKLASPMEFYAAIIRVSRRKPGSEAKCPQHIDTLYKAAMFLAAQGKVPNPTACSDFVELVDHATAREYSAANAPPRETLDRKLEWPGLRATNGRFLGSGNPRGRPRKKAMQTPTGLRRAVLETANMITEIKLSNRDPERMTLFESKLIELAYGATKNRMGCKRFVHRAITAACQEEQIRANASAIRERKRHNDMIIRAMVDDMAGDDDTFSEKLLSYRTRTSSDEQFMDFLERLGII